MIPVRSAFAAVSGRCVDPALTQIVISRLEDGQIVEDWAATDSLVGPWRSLLLGVKHWRLLQT